MEHLPKPAAATSSRHILIIGSTNLLIANVRGDFIRALLARGHKVTVAGCDYDPPSAARIEAWGAAYVELPLGRAGLNPLADIRTFVAIHRFVRSQSPDIFFGYSVKPIVYGLIAARLAGVPRRIALIAGLGYAFTEGDELKRRIVRAVAKFAYGATLGLADRVIFQNADDLQEFVRLRILAKPERAAQVNGSGVDLAHYAAAPLPDGPTTFLLIARLLRDKGVYEYAEAARIVKRRYPTARFLLVGPFDPNPSAVRPRDVEAWVREGLIDYRGVLGDVRPAIRESHVYVLPSIYREGVPRSILEAMAMGRPIVTADRPGCRETVIDGKNGFLVPTPDVTALANACARFLAEPALIATAGAASRALAQSKFDSEAVTAAMIRLTEED